MTYALKVDTINARLIGYTDVTEYWQLDARSIFEYELIFMQSGSIEITMNNVLYVLKSGDCLFIEPGVIHEGKAIKPGRFFYVHIEGEVENIHMRSMEDKIDQCNAQLKAHVAENSFYVLPNRVNEIYLKTLLVNHSQNDRIVNLFDKAIVYRDELTISHMLFINICVKEIFVLIQQEMMIQLAWNDVFSSHGKINPYVKEAVIYIKNNVKKKITASNVSDSVGISHQYLNRLFREILGCTIIAYVNKQKIHVAKELIKSTTLPFMEIAFEIGLENPYYLSRLFKKEEGISPSAYRKRLSSNCNG